jgi:hypothetical protein
MKVWVFLVQRPVDKEPVPVMYWGASELHVARRTVEIWPNRISDARELDLETSEGKGEGREL